MGRPSARHQSNEPEGALVPILQDCAGSPPTRGAFDAPTNVATSRAARHFATASLVTALLVVASAALFHQAAGSSGSLTMIAVNCLLAAALVQVVARRWMRDELVADGLRQGLEEPEARRRARLAVSRWLGKPR
jgi:hypothetical protein